MNFASRMGCEGCYPDNRVYTRVPGNRTIVAELPGSEAAKSAITDLNLIGLRLQEPTTLYPYLTPTFLSPVFSSPILTAYDETLKVATIQIQNKDATRTIVYTVDLARDEPRMLRSELTTPRNYRSMLRCEYDDSRLPSVVTRIVADSNGRTEERAVITKRDDRTPPESLFAPPSVRCHQWRCRDVFETIIGWQDVRELSSI
jgi:hypothetical protein